MSAKNPLKRGRPPSVDNDRVINVILKYKADIIRGDGGIVSKLDPVWTNIAKELDYVKNEPSLYTYVSCNKFDIRTKLTNNAIDVTAENVIDTTNNSTLEESETSIDLSREEDESAISFDIHVPKSDIDKLLITKVYPRKTSKKGPQVRTYAKFRPGEWQDLLSTRIWKKTHSECGYNYKYHSVSRDGTTGHVVGQCHCGSQIKCFFHSDESDVTTIKCTATKGNGKCCKRPLRAPIRQAVGKELLQKSVFVYRAEKANDLMREGDPEPPILPKASVLRNAKHEFATSFLLDRDPIKALHIMQLHALKHVIHGIGLSPFYVMYSTNHQHSVYRSYARNENSCISIDATGSIIKPIIQPDKSKSRSIFLYVCVIRSVVGGQLAVAQMLSERHHTNAISFWLREWIEKPGLPPPKEIVCDASKALLTAAIRAFTNFSTINDYSDACRGDVMPACYIRIDVAHFIKIYADYMKELRPSVKKFYLASIGQIILSCDVERVRKIVYAILVIARSDTEGSMSNGELSACEKEKNYLSQILTYEIEGVNFETNEGQVEESVDIEVESEFEVLDPSKWFEWAQDINRCVSRQIELQGGMRINAHYFPALANRLLRDLKWLPLWSCVARNKFGYGRIPASSASVESEFKNIKVHLLKQETLPMRVDQFVAKHVDHISGATKLAEAAATAAGKVSPEIEEQNDSEFSQDMLQANNDSEFHHEHEKSACPACINGDEPTGAHRCFVCKVAVHAIDLCSSAFSGDEEGYGQRRICIKCKNQKNIPDIIAAREFENWGGLAESRKEISRPGRYLKGKYAPDEFLLKESIRKIPILKNGGNVTLRSVNMGKENYTLGNTCAFDSIFQIFLTAASDHSCFRNWIEKYRMGSDFFRMLFDVLEKGVQASSYRTRCRILLPIYKKGPEEFNSTHLQCEITIADLGRKLFDETPSFQDYSVCDGICSSESTTNLGLLIITQSSLLDTSYNVKIEEAICLPEKPESERKCPTKGCTGNITKSLQAPGNFVIFEVMPDDGPKGSKPAMLRDIPKTLQLSFMDEQYVLAGAVNFKAPRLRTSDSSNGLVKSIGHYTALCHRNGTWIEFDDTKESGNRQPNKREISLHIVIYVR